MALAPLMNSGSFSLVNDAIHWFDDRIGTDWDYETDACWSFGSISMTDTVDYYRAVAGFRHSISDLRVMHCLARAFHFPG